MYVSSDQSCNAGQGTSQTPIPPSAFAADRAARVVIQQQVATGNQQMRGLVNRDWQDFASLGPQVAWQVLNTPTSAADAYGPAAPGAGGGGSGSGSGSGGGGPVVGVEVGSAGSGAGSGKSWVPPKRRNGARSAATQQEKAAFVDTFGGKLTPWQAYSGPLPPPGSAMSQVYGGSPSNRSVAFGAPPAATPNPSSGYYQSGSCPPAPVGVDAFPLGEPIDMSPAGGGSAAAGGDASNGALWALAAILGLAGLAMLSEHREQRKRRKAAA